MTHAEWEQRGERLFGTDRRTWRFVCPCCHHVASVQDYLDSGAPLEVIGFSCIGRWEDDIRGAFESGPGPCDYTGGGLLGMNPVEVDGEYYFSFAHSVPADRPDIVADPEAGGI